MSNIVAWILWGLLFLTGGYGVGMSFIFGAAAASSKTESDTGITVALFATAGFFLAWSLLSAWLMHGGLRGWSFLMMVGLLPAYIGIGAALWYLLGYP